MSRMEALRQAAPPPRRGRQIVLSSDSEGDSDVPVVISSNSKKSLNTSTKPASASMSANNRNGVMRPTDAQQVEAHSQAQGGRGLPTALKDTEKADSGVEALDFDKLKFDKDRSQQERDQRRHVIEVDSRGHRSTGPEGSRGKMTMAGFKPVSTSGPGLNAKTDVYRGINPTQPEARPASNPSKPSSTNSADYAKFKSTGAFASPAKHSSTNLRVDPSSPFYRPQKPALPQDHWMVSQLNAHHARQRQNGRPSAPAGSGAGMGMGQDYGIAAGYAAKSAAHASGSASQPGPAKPRAEEDGEDFSSALDDIKADPMDYTRVSADQAEADMRELLSGAIGDGEDNTGGAEEGANLVEGFADGMTLMPHQIRGVSWMGQREVGTKRGGILADDMGLGKTVQTIANILKRPRNKAEEKLGYTNTTLIVTPLSVMDQWVKEIKNKTSPGRLKVCSYHGPQRGKIADKLHKFDVVVTTYSTLSSEHGAPAKSTVSKAKSKSKAASTLQSDSESGSESDGERFGKSLKKAKPKTSPLFQIKWLRVVCDEAQQIKNRNTKAAKAAVALDARLRWCLTGTPIQNNVEELFSLFQFLRARPLDDWGHFKERIIQPVKAGRPKQAMKRIHAVLKAVMLRRTKDATIDGKAILNLPARNVNVISCEFDRAERDFYDALEKKQALTFNRFLKAGTAMSNYTSVLTLLLRMRQACCHPSLVTASLATDASAIESKPATNDNLEDDVDELADLMQGAGLGKKAAKCEICLAPLEDPAATSCDDCQDFVRKAREGSDATPNMPPSSAKTRMTVEILRQIADRSDGEEKTIIFSQFTSFLNIVEPFLKQAGVKYVRYDGSMRADKREQALEAIRNKPEIKVILISFKAGSTGLNLTCCNNVILMDLWWNPALEDQAYDRAHRLGQKLDVHIYKLTVRESVEDRILKLQEAKRELAKAALSGDSTKNMKLQLQDLMDLFKPGHTSHDDDE